MKRWKAMVMNGAAALLLGVAVALTPVSSSAAPMHCEDSCSSGPQCHAHARCEDGFCDPVTEPDVCLGLIRT